MRYRGVAGNQYSATGRAGRKRQSLRIAVLTKVSSLPSGGASYPPRGAEGLRLPARSLGAKHVFIKPDYPWRNGKVERYNRALQTEWAYRQGLTTNDARCAALAPRLEHYKNQRRHAALGGQPPASRLSPT